MSKSYRQPEDRSGRNPRHGTIRNRHDGRQEEPYKKTFNDICNNCGKHGHTFKHCKNAITSFGVIIFRITPFNQREYLMIRRKDTLGYIDFMRGKYSVSNHNYILNMLKQMTASEKYKLANFSFDELWEDLWEDSSSSASAMQPPPQDETPEVVRKHSSLSDEDFSTKKKKLSNSYRQEEINSREKFLYLSKTPITPCRPEGDTILQYLLMISNVPDLWKSDSDPIPNHGGGWKEPEWGFPKGRRNHQENDYECALREMTEETGFPASAVKNIKNILPFDEIFIGSNYKSYKHRYFLMYMKYEDSLDLYHFEKSEVSCMEWKSYMDCIECIRPYNLEKKRLITNIETTLSNYTLFI
jgi:8-oxo-dGTP pyrophosphatase MutT (NUDIX family)